MANTRGELSRRDFIGAAAAAAGAGLAPSLARSRTVAGSAPNILLIVTDQHAASAMSGVGCPHVDTPNLDAMMSEGTLFTESYSADPACCPARSSFYTGRAPCEHGVLLNNMDIDEDIPDVGAWLSDYADYDVYFMGKWHVPGRRVGDSFSVLSPSPITGAAGDLGVAQTYEGLLHSRSSSRPFLAVVSLLNPHDICLFNSHLTGEWEVDRHGLSDIDLPPLPPNFHAPNAEAALYEEIRRGAGRGLWSRERWRLFRWTYFRYVEMVDRAIGRLLDLTWNSRFGRDTAVIYTSDHGEMNGEQKLTMKGDFYEGAARVPMIVAWPGELPAGRVDRRRLVSGLDITPTICGLAGVEPPPLQRGLDLTTLLDGSASSWRDFLQVQAWVEGRMIRTELYKYVTWRDDPVVQLFDLQADPWEVDNLAEDSAYSSVLEDLAGIQEEHEDTLEHTDLSLAGYDAAAVEAAA